MKTIHAIPCPFCQAKARPVIKYMRDHLFYVECSDDKCAAMGPSSKVSIEDAVQKWNLAKRN